MNEAWNKDRKNAKSPNVLNIIHRFNEFAFFVETVILQVEKLADRAKAVEYWIAVAESLFKMNNFNNTMAVLSALHSVPIERLKFTIAAVSESKVKTLTWLDEMMSSEKSFSRYRHRMRLVDMGWEPAIPFIGIHLTDLTFFNQNKNAPIPEEKDFPGEFTNKAFVRSMKAVVQILKFQARPYVFLKSIEQLQEYLRDYPCLDEEVLFQLSQLREPRGAEYEDLL